MAQATQKGQRIVDGVAELARKYPEVLVGIRGRGLMLGMEFVNNELGYEVAKRLFERNILIGGTYISSTVLRVEPPLNIPLEQIESFLGALGESLALVAHQKSDT